jgi:hypothetical protein
LRAVWAGLPTVIKEFAAFTGAIAALLTALVAIGVFDGDDDNGQGASTTPTTQATAPGPTGQIISPTSGEAVNPDIEARGMLANVPEDEHVWLVVRDGNLLYPQDTPITPADGEWSLSFHQGGETKVISLELYRMGDEGHELITGWFDAGDFSGISRIPGAERLDTIENLRIRG